MRGHSLIESGFGAITLARKVREGFVEGKRREESAG